MSAAAAAAIFFPTNDSNRSAHSISQLYAIDTWSLCAIVHGVRILVDVTRFVLVIARGAANVIVGMIAR